MKNEACGLLIMCGNELLLLKRSKFGDFPHTWDLPGGCVEPDEAMNEAIEREVKEETNLDTTQNEYVGKSNPSKDFTFHYFLRRVNTKPEIKLNHEHTTHGWFNIRKLPQDIHPKLGEYLVNNGCFFRIKDC